ncbi:hypothetical protein PspLS_08100 [Pyricularia sp. CBS 133598]|nr:hypothetical protein PspLS_08100 [Pyricularia sp. CBS 133598]
MLTKPSLREVSRQVKPDSGELSLTEDVAVANAVAQSINVVLPGATYLGTRRASRRLEEMFESVAADGLVAELNLKSNFKCVDTVLVTEVGAMSHVTGSVTSAETIEGDDNLCWGYVDEVTVWCKE